MKNAPSLYRMELKKNRSFFIIIIVLQLLLISSQSTVKITQYINNNSLDPLNVIPITNLLLYGTFLSFPLMMLYSWYREEKDYTNYQVFSYPVLSHAVIRNKLKAFLSIGIIWIIFYAANDTVRKLMALLLHRSYVIFDFSHLWYYPLHFFSILVLLLGFACLVIGIMQMVRHRRLLIGTGFILFGSVLYTWTFTLFRSFLLSFFNNNLHDFTQTHRHLALLLDNTVYPLLLGIACMYIGFFLFEKFSEV